MFLWLTVLCRRGCWNGQWFCGRLFCGQEVVSVLFGSLSWVSQGYCHCRGSCWPWVVVWVHDRFIERSLHFVYFLLHVIESKVCFCTVTWGSKGIWIPRCALGVYFSAATQYDYVIYVFILFCFYLYSKFCFVLFVCILSFSKCCEHVLWMWRFLCTL